jgi:hypothetical protein
MRAAFFQVEAEEKKIKTKTLFVSLVNEVRTMAGLVRILCSSL